MWRRFVLIAFLSVASLFGQSRTTVDAIDHLFAEADLFAVSPRARTDLVRALASNRQLLKKAGITSKHRLTHFLSQVATETNGFQRIDESLNYSETVLLRTFTRERVSAAKARELSQLAPQAVKERAIANWLYGEILGNEGRQTNDGWNYRGSGFIQLTGRANFRTRGLEVNLPLELQPELARQPYEGLLSAIAYWSARGSTKRRMTMTFCGSAFWSMGRGLMGFLRRNSGSAGCGVSSLSETA